MRVDFLAIAETELVKAVSYYNGLSEGLGDEFAIEVKHTITRILRFPEAWASLSARTSRCCTKRFPYGVVYQVRGDTLSYCFYNAPTPPSRFLEITIKIRRTINPYAYSQSMAIVTLFFLLHKEHNLSISSSLTHPTVN